jgi:hypothetical protein
MLVWAESDTNKTAEETVRAAVVGVAHNRFRLAVGKLSG